MIVCDRPFLLMRYSDQMLCLCQTDFNFNIFGLANAINNHLSLTIRVVCVENF